MDTVLAVGATGACVEKLRALAAAAGITMPPPGPAGTPLAPGELEALEAHDAQGVMAAELDLASGAIVKGQLVTQSVWDGLRRLAEERTGLVAPQPSPGSPADASAASTSDASVGDRSDTSTTAGSDASAGSSSDTQGPRPSAPGSVGRFDPSVHSSGAPS